MNERWKITVGGGYGSFEFDGAEAEAEQMRRHKANWEGAVARKERLPADLRFYRASEKPYGVFSNLFRRPFVFECTEHPTAEHAYQAGKARKPEVRAWLLAAPSPSLLAMAAHGLYSWDIAPGWSRGRRARMHAVVEAKFRQNEDLAEILLGTGDARLVESATVDSAVNRRWGEVNGKGENWLGLILMDVRAALREGADRRPGQAGAGGE